MKRGVSMQYIYRTTDVRRHNQSVVVLGNFDGVHKGHQAVIEAAKQKAEQLNIKSAVMTFDPHPSIVLGRRNEKVFYITPLSQKIDTFKKHMY